MIRPGEIDRPIFFIGMGRSGTTMIFDVFAARPDLAWFSQHMNRLPWLPAVSLLSRAVDLDRRARKAINRSDERRSPAEKLRVGPAEAYGVWERCCGEKFLFDYLLGVEATDAERRRARRTVAKVLRYAGRSRFATKITGPARIGYLTSIFPDARFVHIVRDGRAVVHSLLSVHFWKGSWREREPAWRGGLDQQRIREWREAGGTPAGLAAIQWAAVVESAREEAKRFAPERYAELRYEDFVSDPHAALDRLTEFCELPPNRDPHEFLDQRIGLRDMNYRWREELSEDEAAMFESLIGSTLPRFGYTSGGGREAPARDLLTLPFA